MNYLVPIPISDALDTDTLMRDQTRPTLVSFALDMDSANVTLTFTEAVNASSLQPSGLTLHSANTTYTLTGGFVIDIYSTVVVMNLNDADFDRIKAMTSLCAGDDTSDCSLTIDRDSILDMSQNGNNGTTLTATKVTKDTTPPYLVYYDLDLNSEELHLTFSEVVIINGDHTSQAITLLATPFEFDALSNASKGININETDPESYSGILQAYSLSGGEASGPNTIPDHPPVLTISLTQKDLNLLKSLEFVATGFENTYLLISSGAAMDYSGIPLMEEISGKQVRVYTADQRRPSLVDFQLDMNIGVLTMTFTETVNRSSLLTPFLFLQGSEDSTLTDIYPLTGGESTSYDNPVIEVTLSLTDVNEIKRRTLIATDNTTTYLSLDERAISDQDSNRVLPISPTNGTLAERFIPDITNPTLLQFSLDLNTGQIHLTFDETVNTSSFDITTLILSNSTTTGINISLGVGILLSNDSTVVSYRINEDDLNYVKLEDLCRAMMSGSDCYLSIFNGTVQDMNSNPVTAVFGRNSLLVDPYVMDNTAPEIVYFAVNMSLGNVTLEFSEVVDVSTFDPTHITLHEFQNMEHARIYYNLTGGTRVTNENGLFIDFYLNKDDLEFLRRNEELFISQVTSYISASAGTVKDMSNNLLEPIGFKLADRYAADTIGPRVIGASLNLTEGTLELTFSETIRAASFRPSTITLLNQANTTLNDTVSYILTGGSFGTGPEFDSTILTLNLTSDDIREIQARETLATSPEDSYLIYTSLLATDLASNAAEVIGTIQITDYFRDSLDPKLFSFVALDLSERIMIVEFDEPVDITTVNISHFILQETVRNVEAIGNRITLTGGTFSYLDPEINQKKTLILQFTADDYRTIVLDDAIAKSQETTHISLPLGAVFDFAGNPLVDIPENEGSPVQQLIEDSSIPQLLEYDLDIDSGLLTLEFDNVMNPATLNPSALAIQNNETASTRYQLIGGVTNSSSDYMIVLQLADVDLNEIKRITEIATRPTNTYITFSAELIDSHGGMLDTLFLVAEGVDVLAVTDGNAKIVRNFTSDSNRPSLISFNLDLNSNELTLTFNETVDASELNLTDIILQNASSIPSRQYRLTLRMETDLIPTMSTQQDSTVITVNLGFDDRNDIKRFTDIAISNETTYISLSNDTIVDMNSQPIIAIPSNKALRVLLFTEDATSPSLKRFSLDVNHGILELTFDETVNASSLHTNTILLQNDENELIANESVPLTESSFTNSEDDYIIIVNISTSDLNKIKRYQYLAQSDADTFIVIVEDTIQDMNDNPAMPISRRAAQRVGDYTKDSTEPKLLSFHLDMDNGVLFLTFDETVDISTFQYTGIMFFSSDNLTEFNEMYNLTSNQQSAPGDSHIPYIELSLSDQYELKLLTLLATSINDTFIDIDYGTVRDMALDQNPVEPTILPIQAENFTRDGTPPTLNRFTANLNSSLLSLIFDEPVNVSSLQFDRFTLLNSRSELAVMYTLSGGSSLSENGRFIDVNITEDDSNEIKKMEDLFTGVDNTFLTYESNTVKDMAGNEIVGIEFRDAKQAADFTIDTTRPSLDAFDLDMTAETLTLYFSETVNILTLSLASITLQQSDSATQMNDSFRLTGGVTSMVDDTMIRVQLLTEDLNQLKTYKIAINNNSVWLTIDEGGILDQSDERLLPKENNKSAIPVSNYQTDKTPPTLESFVLDLDGEGQLWLNFSETVDANTFNSTSIILLNNSPGRIDSDASSFTLTPSSSNWDWDLPIQRISLSTSDLNEIKRLYLLATNENNTFISISAGGIDDVFGNPVVEVNITLPRKATDVIPDDTLPYVVSYNLNLTAETIIVTFSETVNASSLSITDFTLFNESPINENTSSFQLTQDSGIDGGDPVGQDSTVLIIRIGTNDLNRIKQLTDLAVSNFTTYLSLSSTAIADMSSNLLVAITNTNPRAVSKFYGDTIQPSLLNFGLDLDSGILSLTFDETVNASSIKPDQITLLDDATNDTIYQHTLTGAKYISSVDDTLVLINLTDADLNEIKRQVGLATNESVTFISITDLLVVDMNLNPVIAIIETAAQNVTDYTNDTTMPELLAFDFDLTNDTLTLTFSETVRTSTLHFQSVVIQNEVNTEQYQLKTGYTSTPDNTVVVIQLDNVDLNEIKTREDLATDENNTYISINMFLVEDMNHNFNRPRFLPLQVSNYTSDRIKPQLLEFELDMDGEGLLQLSFTETINVSSLLVSEITLLQGRDNVNGSHTLELSYVNTANGPIVDVVIGLEDLNILKRLPVAISRLVTFISITDKLVLDMNDNTNIKISVYEAYGARGFIDDTTPPELESFTIDLNSGLLMLNFSETVLGSTLQRTHFTIQNDSRLSVSHVTLMMDDVSYLSTYPSLIVNLSDAELNDLKRIIDLATDISDTWLSVETNGVVDTFSLSLVAIEDSDSLQAVGHTPDTTDPTLIDFDIDLNVGTLTLVFDETVDTSSLNLTQVTLQDTVFGETNNTYTLTSGEWTMQDSTRITVYLSFTDQNSIKKIRELASYDPSPEQVLQSGSGSAFSESASTSGELINVRNNTYISITNQTIVDMNSNPVTPIPTSEAKQVREIILDSTPPQLVSFDFNLDTEQLILTFTETMDTLTLMLDQFTVLGNPHTANYTLTGGFTHSNDDYIIVIQLDITDVNNIKRDFSVAVSDISTNIFLSSFAILDMNANLLNFTEPKMVTNYQNDTRDPILVSFNLDLNSNELVLTFNETIWVDTLNVTKITIQESMEVNRSDLVTFRTLELGIPLTENDTVLVISLQPADTNFIKTYPNLATSENNTYISLSELALTDTNGNPITSIAPENGTQVLNFTADKTGPILVQFELDLTAEEIRFVFDETVNSSSLDPTRITLYGAEDGREIYYMLDGGSVQPLVDSTNVTLHLELDDLNEVKKNESLITSINNSFIGFDELFLVDMNNNMIVPITPPNVTRAFIFIEDKVDPKLESFHLNLTRGVIYLTFSETVRSLSLKPASFTLQSLNNSANVSYQLTGGMILSPNLPEVTLELVVFDLNSIKRITDLGTDENNTYITVTAEGIRDMNNNSIKAISEEDALPAQIVTSDRKRPTLSSFSFDLDSDILWLTFDETMLVSELNGTQITLVNGGSLENLTTMYTLQTSGLLPGSQNDPVVPVLLSRLDSNEIKKDTDLATNESNTFIALSSDTITDMNLNPVVPVTAPRQVTNYTEDETQPKLEQLVVDMDSRTVFLYFSETVNVSTLRVNEITLQDADSAVGPNVTLSSPTFALGDNQPVIPVRLSMSDANLLTSLTNLYNNRNDSFITITNFTVWDMNDNNVIAVEDGNATRATQYFQDVTNVSLVNFTVDLDRWILSLSFNETVSSSTFDYTKIHLFSDDTGTINLTLTNGSFNLPYTHLVTLNLTANDICRIKVTEDLWTSLNDTWLYVEQGAVHDWTERNPLNEIIEQAESLPIENNPPKLVTFTFNVTDGVLLLNFDEPVRPMTLIYPYFRFQNESKNYTESLQLSGGQTNSPNGKHVTITLTPRDLNFIKSLTSLFTSPNTSFLSLNEGAILDMRYNPSAPIEGFPITKFFNDTGEPSLVNFAIDMNSGKLTLTFSETVDVSTFNMTLFRLQSDSDVPEYDTMQFHYFTEETFAFTSDQENMLDNRIVLVNISLDDLNEIKRKRIAYDISTAWLVIDDGALTDNNLRPVVPLENGVNAKQAGNYTNDAILPELLYFDLSLDSGILTLYFSETVDATTLDVSQITLQSAANISTAEESFYLVNSSFYPVSELSIDDHPDEISGSGSGSGFLLEPSGDFSWSGSSSGLLRVQSPSYFTFHTITLYLSHYDSNSIKALTQLAVDNTTTYISMTAEAVRDTVSNIFSEVEPDSAMMVREYFRDETRPVLRQFDLDIDSGNLTLTFTETVNVTSLDVTQLMLINQRSQSSSFLSSYSLHSIPAYPNTSASFSDDWPVVLIQIGHEDLDAIKNIRDLATKEEDTLLVITASAIRDNAGNPVVPRMYHEAQRVDGFIADTTRPKLASFDLDLDDGRLILTFTETVKIINSLNVTQITLQNLEMINENNSLSSYTLTSDLPFPSTSVDGDSRVVFIRLGFTDLNAIKYRSTLATQNRTSFLSITNKTVVDLNNNAVEPEENNSGQQVRIYTPDQSDPVLLAFSLNMSSTTLILTFNETVNASSLDVREIAIQHFTTSSSSYHSLPLYLTPGWNETHTDSDNGHILIVHLGPTDRNELKRRTNLAVSNDTTYLVATPAALSDMSGNPLDAVIDGGALPVNEYTPDTLPPVTTSFNVDMDLGTLVITFNETVNASSLVLQGLTLQDNTTAIDLNFTLNGGEKSTSDSTILEVYFTAMDFNTIKRLTLCREEALCYLRHEAAVVIDMVDIDIEERADGEALQVTKVTRDTIPPEVITFTTNLTSEIVSLTFSETVNASSINYTAFTLQDFFEGTTNYTLTDGTLLSTDGTVIDFQFALVDLNEIKRNTDLFTIRFNSWLTFTEYAIHDMALMPNRVRPVMNTRDLSEGLPTLELVPDSVEPELWDFDLNLTSHQLILYFSETVEARTLNINEITLQNSEARSEDSEYVTLQMGTLPLYTQSFTGNYHILVLDLGERDTNSIKAFTDLATNENNTYITLTVNTVRDMNKNPIIEIPSVVAKRVSEFYSDFVQPELRGFSLDLNTGELHLTFSETINASSLQINEIVLQNSRDGAGTNWTLTAEQLTEGVVLMSGSGVDYLVSGLGSMVGSMSASGSGSGSGLELGSGSGSAYLTPDNMSINDSAINSTDADFPDLFQPYHSLTQSADGPVITISLGFTDRNAIKRLLDLGTSEMDTYISISSDAFNDMNGNELQEISRHDAINATEVIMDETPPHLVYFDLNLTSEILSLTFDETVNASSLHPSSIVIQAAEFTPMVSLPQWHQLGGGVGSVGDNHIIHILLNTTDLNEIKQLTDIATAPNNTYITFFSDLVSDTNGNAVTAITNGRGLPVRIFTEDTIRPMLNKFSLDMNRALLHLTFSETVNSSSFNVQEITLQYDRINLMNRSLTLSPPSRDLLEQNDDVITVQLGASDLNYIKSTEMFGLSTADTWLTLTEDLVQDMNNNPVIPVVDGKATRVASFIPDETRPRLLLYHFDFIQETISLIFTEPINISLINYTLITVQDGPNADNQYTLTGGTVQSYDDGTVILISFNEADINHFKLHPSLATSENDTYLAFDSHAFFDTATIPNPVHPHIDGVNATNVVNFTYYEAPQFMSVQPTAGRASGGTLITIIGANFGSLSNEMGARRVDVYIDGILAMNTTVTVASTTIQALTPALSSPELAGMPLNLTVTIDNSTLSLTIPSAYTYLPPPLIRTVFPAAATLQGGTLVIISGDNFGPPSLIGPEVSVNIGNGTCTNVSVVNTTFLSCRSPSLPPGQYNVTVTVDGISDTISDAFRSLEPPVLHSISPTSTYRYTPIQVNITGENFGPTTVSATARPLLVNLESHFNLTECTDPVVLIEDTLLTCTLQPNLGPGNVTLLVDDIVSTSAMFFHFDDAANFSFEFSEFFVSETEQFANVSVVRFDFPPFASPADITVWAFSYTAIDDAHFQATNITQTMPYSTHRLNFQISITAGSYLPDKLRKGASDDVSIGLEITAVTPLHGRATIFRQQSLLTIKAVCQVVSHVCVAAWDMTRLVYYRLDELP